MGEKYNVSDSEPYRDDIEEVRRALKLQQHYEMRELFLQFIHERPYPNDDEDGDLGNDRYKEWTHYCADVANRHELERQALDADISRLQNVAPEQD